MFPSEFEGLGLVLIEAQAAGLPCYTSKDVVPNEAKVSDLLTFIPLDDNPEEWANVILNNKITKRNTPKDAISSNGYDIQKTARFLQEYYLQKL